MSDSDSDGDVPMAAGRAPAASSSSNSSAAATGGAGGPAMTAIKGDANTHLPWVEKYRPSSLDDLVSQGEIVNTINRLIAANRLPHLLFYGPPGTGKTSTVLAIAKKLYGPQWQSMTLELNASDDRGIDVVREQIKSFAGTRKLFSTGVKLVVLDEADAMTQDAQFALRRVIEKYARNTRFCLICNYVSKIIPALQSRCTRFRFAPLAKDAIQSRLGYIVDKEGLSQRLTPEGNRAVLALGGGDMRKVLNILQSSASGYDVIDEDAVYAVTGNPRPAEVREALGVLLKGSFIDGYKHIQALSLRGYAVSDLLTELSRYTVALSLPPGAKALLLDKLADVEYRLAFGTSDKLQTAAMVAAYHGVRVFSKQATAAGASGGAS